MKATGISTWAGTWKKGNGFISTRAFLNLVARRIHSGGSNRRNPRE